MGDMSFPAGSMLWVQREALRDVHGDPVDEDGAVIEGGWSDRHQIGPCSMSGSSTQPDGKGETRAVATTKVEAPATSDVRKSDRIKLPNGVIAAVTSAIERPRNPFTGWTPFLNFTLKEVT